jgi:hypothetical protein
LLEVELNLITESANFPTAKAFVINAVESTSEKYINYERKFAFSSWIRANNDARDNNVCRRGFSFIRSNVYSLDVVARK